MEQFERLDLDEIDKDVLEALPERYNQLQEAYDDLVTRQMNLREAYNNLVGRVQMAVQNYEATRVVQSKRSLAAAERELLYLMNQLGGMVLFTRDWDSDPIR